MKILVSALFILSFYQNLLCQQLDTVDISQAPFTYVERMPEFVGGTEEMYRFVYSNIQYPDSCRKENGNVQVIVQFVVDTTGHVIKPKVVRGHPCGFNEEALRVINLMNENEPHWNPGIHNGRATNVSFTLPIKFTQSKK